MIRWLPLGATLPMGIALWLAIPQNFLQPSILDLGEEVDEALMYAVEPGRGVRMRVPAGTREVVLHMVAVVDVVEPYDVSREYAYAIEAQLNMGRSKISWPIHSRSRLSLERGSLPYGKRGTHLLERDAFATDNRIAVLPVASVLGDRSAVLELRVLNDTPVLVRAFARGSEQNEAIGFDWVEGATVDRKLQLGSGLHYGDLPARLIRRAAQSKLWRLEALGRRGVDYGLERVVLTSYRRRAASRELPALQHDSELNVGPHRWIALTLQGSVHLIVHSPEGTRLRIVESLTARSLPKDEEVELVVGPSGQVSWISPRPFETDLRTVALRTMQPSTLRLELTQGAQFALDPVSADETRPTIQPDWRRSTYAALSEQQPLLYDLPAGQPKVRVLLRRRLAVAPPPEQRPQLRARIEMATPLGAGFVETVDSEIPASSFERFDGEHLVTKGKAVELEVPAEGGLLRIYGPSDTYARAYAPVPGVERNILREPYRDALPDEEQSPRFRYAPYDIRTWAAIEPINPTEASTTDEPSGTTESTARLWMQTRIVAPPDKRPRRLRRRNWSAPYARVLRSKTQVFRQRVLVEQPFEGQFPAYSWTELGRGRPIQIEGDPERSISWVLGDAPVGAMLTFTVDGTPFHRQLARTSSQSTSLSLPTGTHVLHVGGLGPSGHAYIDAPPVRGTIFRRRSVELLTAETPLRFGFAAAAGERQHVLFQILSTSREAPLFVTRARAVTRQGSVLLESTRQRHPWQAHERKVLFRDHRSGRFPGWWSLRVQFPRHVLETQRQLELALEHGEGKLWVRTVLLSDQPHQKPARAAVMRESVP